MPKSPLAAGLLALTLAAGWAFDRHGAPSAGERHAASQTAQRATAGGESTSSGIAQCVRYDSGEVVRNEARPVRAAAAGEVSVATQNLWRLFNDRKEGRETAVTDSREYQGRLAKLSLYLRTVMKSPDVIAVQEVENLATLEDVAARLHDDDDALRYRAFLEEGHDVGGIDSGFLVSPRVEVIRVSQLMADTRFDRDNSFLYDRPPLWLQGRVNGRELNVLAVHLRSMLGSGQGAKAERVREKRFAQAYELSRWIAGFQKNNPKSPLLVVGDFNAFTGGDDELDVIGQIAGIPNDKPMLPVKDLVTPDLRDQIQRAPESDRYSYVHQCVAQALDHVLANEAADRLVSDFAFTRGNADSTGKMAKKYGRPERVSDHDGAVLYLRM